MPSITRVNWCGAVQTPVAEISWLVGTEFQREGFATEAVEAIIVWFKSRDVSRFIAHIHPKHHACMAVAQRSEMRPSNHVKDGEVRSFNF